MARTQGDEVRKCRGTALGVGVVVVAVGGCIGAASSEDVEVFALVTSAGEPFDALRLREVTLGVLLRGAAPGRAYEDDDAEYAEGDDDVIRSHRGTRFGGAAMSLSKRALACASSLSHVGE